MCANAALCARARADVILLFIHKFNGNGRRR